MIASIYSEILQFEQVGGDLVDRLRGMNVYDVFENLTGIYEGERFNKALFYILHTYSLKSKFHVLGADWLDIKRKAAIHSGITIESDLYADTVQLESEAVVTSIQRYLDYQGNRNYKHLCMLKDLYEQMVSSAVAPIKKGLEVDFDQKFKNHDYASKLLLEINEWEQRVAEGNKDLKAAFGEMANRKPAQMSLRMEDNIGMSGSFHPNQKEIC